MQEGVAGAQLLLRCDVCGHMSIPMELSTVDTATRSNAEKALNGPAVRGVLQVTTDPFSYSYFITEITQVDKLKTEMFLEVKSGKSTFNQVCAWCHHHYCHGGCSVTVASLAAHQPTLPRR